VVKFTSSTTIGNSSIQDLTTGVLVNNSVTASGAIARGLSFTPTLTAAANGDVLSALYISPTFTNGSFTGVTNWAINTVGSAIFNGNVVVINPTSGLSYSLFRRNGTDYGSIGIAAAAGDLITNSAINDYCIRANSGRLAFSANNGSTLQMLLTTSGTLGLGTTTVGSTLQVNGNAAIGYSASTAAPTNGLAVAGAGVFNSTTTTSGTVLSLQESATLSSALALTHRNSTQTWRIAVDAVAVDDKQLTFIESGGSTVKMSITQGGNVLIGTTTDGSGKLQIKGSGTTSSTYQLYLTNSAGTNTLYVRDDGVTFATNLSANGGTFGSGTGTQTALTCTGGSANLQFQFTSGSLDATVYNSSSGGIVFKTLSGANALYVNGSGNTGLGTLTVGSKLQVNGNAAIGYSASTAAPTNGLAVSGNVNIGTTTSTFSSALTVLANGTNPAIVAQASSAKTSTTSISIFAVASNENTQPQKFDISYVGAATLANRYFLLQTSESNVSYGGNIAMQSNAGNVGIGLTAPSAKLEVSGSTTAASAIARGMVVSSTLVAAANSDVLSALYINPTFTNGAFTGVVNYALNVVGAGYFSGNISNGAGLTTGQITSGVLGTGLVYSNAGVLTSTNPSDNRLKDNITSLSYGLKEILQLRPVSYHWKDDKINQGVQFGFIAQEVQEIMPDAIKEFGTDVKYLGLEKDAIYAALVKAIKELKEEIEQLKNK